MAKMKTQPTPHLAIVDIETTGMSPTYERIIEIGIIRVENGKIVRTFKSLVNPGRHLSSSISQITNIFDDELNDAPTFDAIALEIKELLDDAVFVAHNVAFDYGFMRKEFERLGISFSSKRMCTVRLSRMLFPQYRRHGLDYIIERYGLECSNRHRAYDDAHVLYQFLNIIKERVPAEKFEHAWQVLGVHPSYPPHVNEKEVDALPNTAGVYIFKDDANKPLYVGKSIDIRNRVLSHFSDALSIVRERELLDATCHIEAIVTNGEFGALMLEAQLIQELQPHFNIRTKRVKHLNVAEISESDSGYTTLSLKQYESSAQIDQALFAGLYRSQRQFEEKMYDLAKATGLCPKLLGLEKSKQNCFSYELGKCLGACIGKEKPATYNMRLKVAIKNYTIKRWPYKGAIKIVEQAAEGKGAYYLVNNWMLQEWGEFESDDIVSNSVTNHEFNYETYKIMASCILNPKKYGVSLITAG